MIKRFGVFATVFLAFLVLCGLGGDVRGDEGTDIRSLEKAADSAGVAFRGNARAEKIRGDLLAGNLRAASRGLKKLEKSGGVKGDVLILKAMVQAAEYDFAAASAGLKAYGASRGKSPALETQIKRFQDNRDKKGDVQKVYGRRYISAASLKASEGFYIPIKDTFYYHKNGSIYEYDGKKRKTDLVTALRGGGRVFGITASIFPKIVAVSQKIDGKYIIKVYSKDHPKIARELQEKIYEDCNNITPFVSMDGQNFLFASDRAGGRGGFDIYLCTYSNGKWTSPVNVGSAINTSGNELYPFLHPDLKNLFFSSNGHKGFGGYDFYGINLSDESYAPVNLGIPINDTGDQLYPLSVDLTGRYLYHASRGRLIRMNLLFSVKPVPTRFIYGNIILGGKKVPGSVTVKVDSAEGEYGSVDSFPDGRFAVMVPYNKDLIVSPVCAGYLIHSLELDAGDGKFLAEHDFDLPRIYKGMRISYMVNFSVGSAEIMKKEKRQLRMLVRVLKDNPLIRFEISGHSSGIGKKENVEKVARMRVAAVMDYLLQGNVNPGRLIVKSYGGEKKLVKTNTAEAAKWNRRVEITVVSWDGGLEVADGGDYRSRLEEVREELKMRRDMNLMRPGYIFTGAALVCFGTGGYFTYKSYDAKKEYNSALSTYNGSYLSWQIQNQQAYQDKLDGLYADYEKNKKYALYSYAAGGVLQTVGIIFFIGHYSNLNTIKELEVEEKRLMKVAFDFHYTPQRASFAFIYRF